MQVAPAQAAWVAVPAGIGLVLAARALWSASTRRRVRERLFRQSDPIVDELGQRPDSEPWDSWLERWLFISGFRGPGAVTRFLLLEGAVLLFGALATVAVGRSELQQQGIDWLMEIPGNVGFAFALVMMAAPWIIFFLYALAPITRVRRRRRLIVESVERDLPMLLALLATLVESGIGFDAALDQVLTSMDPDRALTRELRQFRAESRAGLPRVVCYRSLSKRLDVRSVSSFVSAMVHSEQVGGSVAESLRRQDDEVWSRRRELAIQRAQTLPTKLSFPLVVCFLPGIFVFTFGPAIAEFLRITDEVLSGAR